MINLIVAVDNNGIIGNKGELPWGRLPNDLKHFREITTGHTVVMGRKTFESIGRPLPNRTNIVMTRDLCSSFCESLPEEVFAYANPQMLMAISKYHKQELFIIGGAEIYELFLPYADTIYMTVINGSFMGDTMFPNPFNYSEWDITTLGYTLKDDKNPYECIFQKYQKRV